MNLSREFSDGRPHPKRRPVHVGDLLVACVSEDADHDPLHIHELLSRVDQSAIPHSARYHRVVPLVHEALTRAGGVDPAVLGLLGALRREAALANLRALHVLRHARDALADVDAPWLVVKGPVLSEFLYSRRGARIYHDIDILVRPADFKVALIALERANFHLIDPNWHFHRRWVSGELRLATDGSSDIDLHWHLMISRQIRRYFRIPIPDLIERAREVRVRSVPVQTLDKVDTLIHLSMHACREGGDRLYWLKDIDQAVRNDMPNWEIVIKRAHQWQVNILVGMMLARTRSTLGTAVPDDVVRALLPGAWRVATTTADRLFPPHRSKARGTIATLLAHGARNDLRSSAVAITSDVARMLRQIVGGEPWRREEWDRDRFALDNPHDPDSKRFPAGDDRDRDWLLEEVIRESSSQV
jgi:Uncharacterised nucleotidyltransferase